MRCAKARPAIQNSAGPARELATLIAEIPRWLSIHCWRPAAAISRGTRAIVGETLPQNTCVIRLVKGLGFEVTPAPEEETVKFRLPLS
jgi:hypothetical protein